MPLSSSRRFLLAAAFAGIAAGVASTLVQVALWLLFTDAFPSILWRDARLTAAVILGPAVLPPPATADWRILASATLLHFALSMAYGLLFCALACRRPIAVGALLGAALYLVNLYGFTLLFPWFAVARDWITLAAHLAFGISAGLACRLVLGPRCRPGTGTGSQMS